MTARPLRVTAVAASAQLGGTERVLLDYAARAFEDDVILRVLVPRDGPLTGILREIGVPAEVVAPPAALLRSSQRAQHLVTAPLAVLALRRWARDLAAHPFMRNVDVVYSVAFKSHLATTRAAVRVWHLHEFPPAITGPVWRIIARRLPTAMLANSQAVGNAWHPGKAGPPLTVVPNGVDLDRFKPREKSYWIHDQLGIPRSHRLIGMPAVFARWKGHLEVIEAFRQASAAREDVHFVIVGGSIYDTVAEKEYGEQLKLASGDRIAAIGQQGTRVHLLDFQSKVELVYPEFDFIVHYSLRPEPFGRVILEAMASGVPVLAAAEGGPLEILGGLAPGRTSCGWLVSPRRAGALASVLSEGLALADGERTRLGAAGRRRAEDLFSARLFARGVSDVLRRAVGSHAAR